MGLVRHADVTGAVLVAVVAHRAKAEAFNHDALVPHKGRAAMGADRVWLFKLYRRVPWLKAGHGLAGAFVIHSDGTNFCSLKRP